MNNRQLVSLFFGLGFLVLAAGIFTSQTATNNQNKSGIQPQTINQSRNNVTPNAINANFHAKYTKPAIIPSPHRNANIADGV